MKTKRTFKDSDGEIYEFVGKTVSFKKTFLHFKGKNNKTYNRFVRKDKFKISGLKEIKNPES